MKLKEGGDAAQAMQRPQINWAKGNWGTATFLICARLGSIAALFFWSWPAVITGVVLYWVGGSLGIGMGYHRLITHRGYKVPKLVEYFLITSITLIRPQRVMACVGMSSI